MGHGALQNLSQVIDLWGAICPVTYLHLSPEVEKQEVAVLKEVQIPFGILVDLPLGSFLYQVETLEPNSSYEGLVHRVS